MAGETKAGTLHDEVTTTGRALINLPRLPSMTLFFLSLSGGTAEVKLEVSDDNVLFIPVATVTQSCMIQFAIPASIVAANITSNAGSTITITYRTVVLENIPTETLLIYGSDGAVTRPIITPVETLIEGALLDQNKLIQTQIAASPTTVFTVAAAIQAVIEHIVLVNSTGVDRIVTLWHDGSADSNMILPPTTIVAGGFGIFTGKLSMEPADTLVADCDAATAVTLTAYGYQQAAP